LPSLTKTSTETLTERVEELLRPCKRPPEWGHPGLAATPTSIAVRELAAQTRALEKAVREIALELEKLSE
jgi:signal recognition particle subunit SEC65